MSATITTNPVSTSVRQILADYELHHSDQLSGDGTAPPPNEREEVSAQNPDWWPTDHRRIPNYRPINRDLDREQRPGGSFAAEYVFIFLMLNGVNLNANLSRLWRKTGGRINDKIFYYPIGGER